MEFQARQGKASGSDKRAELRTSRLGDSSRGGKVRYDVEWVALTKARVTRACKLHVHSVGVGQPRNAYIPCLQTTVQGIEMCGFILPKRGGRLFGF